MWACIALTAFPMLARIIDERGLANSSLGTLSLTAGAFDNAASWCVLALVLATFGGRPRVAILAIGGGVLYVAFMLLVGCRLLARLGRAVEARGGMSSTTLAITLALFCVSAVLMDAIGIHAIFGGFLLGACMPRGLIVEELRRKVEPLTVVLLLPMFFTYSGLNTRLDLVNSLPLQRPDIEMIVVAVVDHDDIDRRQIVGRHSGHRDALWLNKAERTFPLGSDRVVQNVDPRRLDQQR